MSVRLKELIRDANEQITPADRHAILDLIEGMEVESKKALHARDVYRAVLEGQEFQRLDELPNCENAVERARAIGETAARISKDALKTLELVSNFVAKVPL